MMNLQPPVSDSENLPQSYKSEVDKAVSKVMVRLVPLTVILYLFNYLDRVNVSFGKLQMNHDLGFSNAVYGFGTSIFFVGYFLFEVPSNLILHRVGARLWIARIMITWGLIAAAMAFIKGPRSFYLLRFLLGSAEAGCFPGILLYYTNWVPAQHRARVGAMFLTSLALAGIVGGPVAGSLLNVHGWGFVGWQWLYLLEGIPTVLLGLVVLFMLPNDPSKAKWLTTEERRGLIATIQREQNGQPANSSSLKFAFTNPTIWVLALQYGLILFAFYALGYWVPSIIQQVSGASTTIIGWLSAIPFMAAILGMVAIGHLSDRTRACRKIVALCAVLGAAGMAGCALTTSTFWIIFFLSIAAIGIYGTLAPFWTIPPALLRGPAAAAGIAMINSVGNLGGGFIGPNVIGQLRDRYHSYEISLLLVAAVLIVAAVFTLFFNIGGWQKLGCAQIKIASPANL